MPKTKQSTWQKLSSPIANVFHKLFNTNKNKSLTSENTNENESIEIVDIAGIQPSSSMPENKQEEDSQKKEKLTNPSTKTKDRSATTKEKRTAQQEAKSITDKNTEEEFVIIHEASQPNTQPHTQKEHELQQRKETRLANTKTITEQIKQITEQYIYQYPAAFEYFTKIIKKHEELLHHAKIIDGTDEEKQHLQKILPVKTKYFLERINQFIHKHSTAISEICLEHIQGYAAQQQEYNIINTALKNKAIEIRKEQKTIVQQEFKLKYTKQHTENILKTNAKIAEGFTQIHKYNSIIRDLKIQKNNALEKNNEKLANELSEQINSNENFILQLKYRLNAEIKHETSEEKLSPLINKLQKQSIQADTTQIQEYIVHTILDYGGDASKQKFKEKYTDTPNTHSLTHTEKATQQNKQPITYYAETQETTKAQERQIKMQREEKIKNKQQMQIVQREKEQEQTENIKRILCYKIETFLKENKDIKTIADIDFLIDDAKQRFYHKYHERIKINNKKLMHITLTLVTEIQQKFIQEQEKQIERQMWARIKQGQQMQVAQRETEQAQTENIKRILCYKIETFLKEKKEIKTKTDINSIINDTKQEFDNKYHEKIKINNKKLIHITLTLVTEIQQKFIQEQEIERQKKEKRGKTQNKQQTQTGKRKKQITDHQENKQKQIQEMHHILCSKIKDLTILDQTIEDMQSVNFIVNYAKQTYYSKHNTNTILTNEELMDITLKLVTEIQQQTKQQKIQQPKIKEGKSQSITHAHTAEAQQQTKQQKMQQPILKAKWSQKTAHTHTLETQQQTKQQNQQHAKLKINYKTKTSQPSTVIHKKAHTENLSQKHQAKL